jgi:cysteinyl-tRNA synthetase
MDELLKNSSDDAQDSDNGTNMEMWDVLEKKFVESMEDDFNTPQAFSVLFEVIKNINRQLRDNILTRSSIIRIKVLFEDWGDILGINFFPPTKEQNINDDVLDILLEVREQLREKKEWELSDKIRSRLNDIGFELEDS